MPADFPLPEIGYPHPRPRDLKLWAGMDANSRVTRRDLRGLHDAWMAVMCAEGWTLVWVPANDVPANAANRRSERCR